MTHPSITLSVCHVTHPSVAPSVQHVTHLSIAQSVCHVTHLSIADCLPAHLSSSTTECLSESCQAKKSSHVDPPKSGEDPCKMREIMGDLGLSTLSLPRFAAHPSIYPSVHHTNML